MEETDGRNRGRRHEVWHVTWKKQIEEEDMKCGVTWKKQIEEEGMKCGVTWKKWKIEEEGIKCG